VYYIASTVSGMTQDLVAPTVEDLGPPSSMRWRGDQVARADAAAARLGLPRSVVQRLAFDKGMEVIEGALIRPATAPADR